MKSSTKCWRESASLIILGRNATNTPKDNYDYKVLVTKRSQKTSFMPSVTVFPGGVLETCDENRKWLNLYEKLGLPERKFKDLLKATHNQQFHFQKTNAEDVEKEISLRIGAIRETFEEVGLLMCKNGAALKSIDPFSKTTEVVDLKSWQKDVHNDPNKFFDLCESLNVAPDIWSLYLWSSWLTPLSYSKRFKTAFFCIGLQNQPDIRAERTEIQDYAWESVESLLHSYNKHKIALGNPQLYELLKLTNVKLLNGAIDFASEQNRKGSTLFFPVQYKTLDGHTMVYPGDDFYPTNPDLFKNPENVNDFDQMTNEDFRKAAKNYNRLEATGKHVKISINIDPQDGHLPPVYAN